MTFLEFLSVVGGVSLFCLAICLIGVLLTSINDWTKQLKRKYQYKHRFDKPPTAECYCVDCTRHDNETGRCYGFGEYCHYTADCWFCWKAEPRK